MISVSVISAYTEEKDNLFEGDHVSREGSMTVLASIINTWISEEIILKAAFASRHH